MPGMGDRDGRSGRFGAIMSTAAVSAGVVQWAAIQVAVARKKYGVKYPKMYEGTAGSVFDCVQRCVCVLNCDSISRFL